MSRARLIRLTGMNLAATFAVVGLIFLAIPGKVLEAFNWLAGGLDWPVSTTQPYTLYLALALGYMYVVTLLAWQMARHPETRAYPWLLAQAKGASAVICLGLFALQEQYLLYLANFVVDGAIALIVWWLCLRARPDAAADGAGSVQRGEAPAQAPATGAADARSAEAGAPGDR